MVESLNLEKLAEEVNKDLVAQEAFVALTEKVLADAIQEINGLLQADIKERENYWRGKYEEKTKNEQMTLPKAKEKILELKARSDLLKELIERQKNDLLDVVSRA